MQEWIVLGRGHIRHCYIFMKLKSKVGFDAVQSKTGG